MLELVAIPAGIELGKFVLDQVLDLSKPVLESYVQDFFKDCLNSGVARLKASDLKKPMAEAIGFFIQRFVKELQFNDIPDTSLEHHYQPVLKRFVRDKAVCIILGRAFETGCKKIDYAQLEAIWIDQYQKSEWQFPVEDFDWRGVAKEYVVQVKGIIKADAELRAILEADLLENIAQNTTQPSPGFDIATYRESLQSSYGYLKLYTLDSTDRADNIRLWRMFIEQTVREALPPIRYDLPLDLKRQLQAEGQLDADLSPEAVELYRRDYFQQPARKALDAVYDSQRTVILGDPGAGKSTLLQYLALEWVEGQTAELPLLIELREYVLAQSKSFLEFLHSGRGVDWQFDQNRLHDYLTEQPTLVMFDGLDEVFDRPTQAAISDDIIRFAQQYPLARVLATSRIIGYNPERFQHADFRQFTIQSLSETEMHEFINRWYDLSMGSDPDRERLKQRLKDAIANSKAIQTLADNPLLLTMMAILNRRQELPRDRAELYDQASRVLPYHWDVDHKRLNLPMDAIGRREKQEMLRLIAYEMQACDDGLKGNLITAERLIRIITNYLRDQGFSEPREKANRLIQQLRERNFILCDRGADTYGFMHRTFLEYFCAVEIVHRFEKQRTLTFEQLRDEIFGQHWHDETWHEVLRLICGMIDSSFAGQLGVFLIKQDFFRQAGLKFLLPNSIDKSPTVKLPTSLILSANCISEVIDIKAVCQVREKILTSLKQEFEFPNKNLGKNQALEIAYCIAGNFPEALDWLKEQSQQKHHRIPWASIWAISTHFRHRTDVLSWFQKRICCEEFAYAREAISWVLACNYGDDPNTFPLLKERSYKDKHSFVRRAAVAAISTYCYQHPETRNLLCLVTINDSFQRKSRQDLNPRQAALEGLIKHYPNCSRTFDLLNDRATNDSDEQLRQWAQEQLEKFKIQNAEFKTQNSKWRSRSN